MGLGCLIHPPAGIPDRQSGVPARLQLELLGNGSFTQINIGRFKGKDAPLRHSLTGIRHQVGNHLLKLVRVNFHQARLRL